MKISVLNEKRCNHLEGNVFIMDNPLVSVIIPVYNCEKYIERCINSLLEQTYNNIEIIVVDDGSTDCSGAICQKYSHNNLIYNCQKNSGPSAARNKGLSLMSGEYVTFVDADDYVAPNYIQELMQLVWKYDVQIAVCSYKKVNNLKVDEKERNIILKQMVLSSDDALKSLFYKKEITAYAVIKLYHVSVVYNQSFMEKLRLGEDLQFIYEALKKVDRIAYSNQELYYYWQNELSITHKYDGDVAEAHWQQLTTIASEAEECIEDAILSRMFIVAYDFLCKMPRKEVDYVFRKELLQFIHDNRANILSNKENKKIVRGIAFCSLFSIRATVFLCKKIKWMINRNKISLKKAI